MTGRSLSAYELAASDAVCFDMRGIELKHEDCDRIYDYIRDGGRIALPFKRCHFAFTRHKFGSALDDSIYVEAHDSGGFCIAAVTQTADKIERRPDVRVTATPNGAGYTYGVANFSSGLPTFMASYRPGSGVTEEGAEFASAEEIEEDHGAGALWALFACLGALELSALNKKKVEPSPFLNRERMKKGKAPIGVRYVVTVKQGQEHTGTPLGGTHASPVPHHRRGHLRHLANGRVVSVRDCRVGFDDDWTVRRKAYRVLPGLPSKVA